MTWEIFKKFFLDRFFPRDMRQSKVEKFITSRQENMNEPYYS